MIERSFGNAITFRLIEFILCAACLGLAIYMLDSTTKFQAIFTYIISMVCAAFLILTLLDLVSLCTPTPIPWTIWLLVCAVGASFFFYASGEFTAHHQAQDLGTEWYIAYVVVFAVTGLIFLLELFCLIGMVMYINTEKTIVKKFVPASYGTRELQKKKEPPLYLPPVEEELELVHGTKPTKRRFDKLDRLASQSDTETLRAAAKERASSITSYGGTFHVSREVAPMPSPPPCRSKKYNTKHDSPRKTFVERKQYAIPSDNALEYNDSVPAISYHGPWKPKERKISTAPVRTSDDYSSRSSFSYKKPEKIVETPAMPNQEPVFVREECVIQSRDLEVANPYNQMGTLAAGTGYPMYNSGTTYQCTRCGCMHSYTAYVQSVQPSNSYQTMPLDVTPTKDCCPCHQTARQDVVTYPPSTIAEKCETTTSTSASESDHEIVVLPGTASDRRNSATSQPRYKTTYMDYDDAVNRRKRRSKQKNISGGGACSIQ